MEYEMELKPLSNLNPDDMRSVKRVLKELDLAISECENRIKQYEESAKHFKSKRPLAADTKFAVENIERFKRSKKELNYELEKWKRKN